MLSARSAVSMSLMYSSALEITSIMACGRNCASIFDSVSSLDAGAAEDQRRRHHMLDAAGLADDGRRRGVLAGGRHHDHEIGGVDLVDQILGAAGQIVEPAAHREAARPAAARRKMPRR